MSDWHKLSPRSRKLLLILMERAKRPIMLSVGKVINLNLATFMSVRINVGNEVSLFK